MDCTCPVLQQVSCSKPGQGRGVSRRAQQNWSHWTLAPGEVLGVSFGLVLVPVICHFMPWAPLQMQLFCHLVALKMCP